jgi:hypothetical protein
VEDDFLKSPEAKAQKEKLIRTEKARLKKLLADLDGNKKKAAEGLIDECAFMRATLKQLREFIDAKGFVDEMQQGSYSIVRESPAMRTYNTMIQKYAAVCKQLFDMLPNKAVAPLVDDEFDKFRNSK